MRFLFLSYSLSLSLLDRFHQFIYAMKWVRENHSHASDIFVLFGDWQRTTSHFTYRRVFQVCRVSVAGPSSFTWCWGCFLLGIKMSGVLSGTEMSGNVLFAHTFRLPPLPLDNGMQGGLLATRCYKRCMLAKFHLVFSLPRTRIAFVRERLETSLPHEEDNPRHSFGVMCLLRLECHR